MHLRLKISIADERDEGFMGIGLVWLLRGIGERGSIRAAADDMTLSYVKALRILNRLEKKLGRKMVKRRRGGHARGGAELTPFAERFLGAYDRMQRRIKRFAEGEFRRFREETLAK